jgi:hypothetical protein
MKHTQAPWNFVPDESGRLDGVTCFEVHANPHYPYWLALVQSVNGKEAECLANAHLIAAAPEMYDALNCWPLKELLGMVEDSGDPKMWSMAQLFMEVQQEAIKKAEGR